MSGRIVTTGALVREGEGRQPMRARVIAEFGRWTWVLALNGAFEGEPLTFPSEALSELKEEAA